MSEQIYVIGIESSCDETAASVVLNGRTVLSNIISSQINIHEKYGGVVPEIASRNHIFDISSVVDEALLVSGISFDKLSAICVTYGPGLVGALLVGLSYGKALSYATEKPLIGVNHIEGHIFANFIEDKTLEPPFMSLVVSGGHTHLVNVVSYNAFEILGRTRDDAAGESFDKVARALGLGYPGGPKIEKAALSGNAEKIVFPRAMITEDNLDFSFSGLKSAVLNYINKANMAGEEIVAADVAASFQSAAVDVLVSKAIGACKMRNVKKLAISGGVACNKTLRSQMQREAAKYGISFFAPNPILCTDNAAMIACRGYYKFIDHAYSNLALNANPGLKIGQV